MPASMTEGPLDGLPSEVKAHMAIERTLRCRTVASHATRVSAKIRSLPDMQIEQELGLDGLEPEATPSELLLATLSACLAKRIHANATIGNIAIATLILDVEADLAVSPIWTGPGREPAPVGFEVVRVKVHLNASAPPEALRALLSHAVLWSPVANSMHSPVHLDVTLVPQVGS
jgi:organic hydroperoxide reductase OsmC/OhrA